MDASVDPEVRATINLDASPEDKLIEERLFQPHHRYFPIKQAIMDKNPKLVQNEGY